MKTHHTEQTALVKAPQQKGAIGAAFLVWLFGGSIGLALLVFIGLKMC